MNTIHKKTTLLLCAWNCHWLTCLLVPSG